MEEARIRHLNRLTPDPAGKYILYWMQQSCRITYNHALSYAVCEANRLGLPLVVCFGLTDDYPEANERHYYFLLEGLSEVRESLGEMGITFVLKRDIPWKAALTLSSGSALTVTDMGYLRVQREWRRLLAESIEVPLIQVESDLIIPVETASPHEVERAYIMREKIQGRIKGFLKKPVLPEVKNKSPVLLSGDDFRNLEDFIGSLNIDRSTGRSPIFRGGYSQALVLLETFISQKLPEYSSLRNIPTADKTSKLSPYLHFGQISSLEVIMTVLDYGYSRHTLKSFYNELVIWRELCYNYCYYNENYDSYEGIGLPWVYETLSEHLGDEREFLYSLEVLEGAGTHDRLWNAAQMEMVKTGRMHGYMRMYWCKKIIEWSRDPSTAFRHAVYLNNRYELDGRDPNGYGGIAWCFGKHDRPVFETPVLGRVRSMTEGWLRKSFDAEEYISQVEEI